MNFKLPESPTHAVRHVSNWDGERDIVFSVVAAIDGAYYDFDNGNPLLEYVGDEILDAWPLNDELAATQRKLAEAEAYCEKAHDLIANLLLTNVSDSKEEGDICRAEAFTFINQQHEPEALTALLAAERERVIARLLELGALGDGEFVQAIRRLK